MTTEARLKALEIELAAVKEASAKRDFDLALVVAISLDEVIRAGGANRGALIESRSRLDRMPKDPPPLSRPSLFADRIVKVLRMLEKGDAPPLH